MTYKEVFDTVLRDYIMKNYKVYDRFIFDHLFRNLLREGYDHEEAKEMIINNCALSTLVLQERIHNDYYYKISVEDKISEDLIQLAYEIAKKIGFFKRKDYHQFLKYLTEREIKFSQNYNYKQIDSAIICSQHYWGIRFRNELRKKNTIYGKLKIALGYDIKSVPDKWDRLYNVDFYIKIGDNYIGLQIKPVNKGIQLPQIYKEKKLQESTHQKFESEFGGKVFYVFSTKINDKKVIVNSEVIDEIRKEINRLEQINSKDKRP